MQQEVIEGFRLSAQQQCLWLLLRQDPTAYRSQCALLIEGELQKEVLREALEQVVEQHEILRTAFHEVPGMNLPLQVILEDRTSSWREVDLSEWQGPEQATELAELERAEQLRAFEHQRGEVLHACLASLAPDKHVLIVNVSAMCADAWSLQNLVREVGRRYTARLSSDEVETEAVQYADFSQSQHELLQSE